jgi:hypothetical protein
MRQLHLCGLAAFVLSGLFAQTCLAGIFLLVDDNSAATFNTDSQANASNWIVDGQDQLQRRGL